MLNDAQMVQLEYVAHALDTAWKCAHSAETLYAKDSPAQGLNLLIRSREACDEAASDLLSALFLSCRPRCVLKVSEMRFTG